jgi:hypothetical protein
VETPKRQLMETIHGHGRSGEMSRYRLFVASRDTTPATGQT